ncbi:MAG: hypothetical protein ACJAVE_000345 [Polaribacter sp.]|jgi:hypothetical protein
MLDGLMRGTTVFKAMKPLEKRNTVKNLPMELGSLHA